MSLLRSFKIGGELRAQLTVGERIFLYVHSGLIFFLPPVAVLLAALERGTLRAVGIGLLFVTLVIYAVPIFPFVQARVKRREKRHGGRES